MKNKPNNKNKLILPVLVGTIVVVCGAILTAQFGSLLTGSSFKPNTNPFNTAGNRTPITTPTSKCPLDPKQSEELLKELNLIDFEIEQLFAKQEVISNRLYYSNIRYSASKRRELEQLIHDYNAKIEKLYNEKNEKTPKPCEQK